MCVRVTARLLLGRGGNLIYRVFFLYVKEIKLNLKYIECVYVCVVVVGTREGEGLIQG